MNDNETIGVLLENMERLNKTIYILANNIKTIIISLCIMIGVISSIAIIGYFWSPYTDLSTNIENSGSGNMDNVNSK